MTARLSSIIPINGVDGKGLRALRSGDRSLAMTIGFIGTGALTFSIVSGLKSLPDFNEPILLSPRNEATAAGLASRYAGVLIAADNQAVLDGCETVMLAVRPQVAQEILSQLRFRSDHRVISLVAILSREDIAGLVAPATQVTRALPMPMVAQRQGATIIYPPDANVAALFRRLAKAIEVDDAQEFNALAVVTATFASYFRYLDTIQGWLTGQGVAEDKARDYITTLYKALANAPDAAPDAGFMHLSQEYATRGGINEQVQRELTERGMFDAFAQSLDGVFKRIAAG